MVIKNNIESFDKIIKHRDINLLFNFIDCYGSHGLAEIISRSPFINELKQKGFTQSCHLCKEILNNINMYKYVLETIRE
ncbi:hypothetical protein PV797_10000 [Clostridiaceae bacterium M8S5]|nr:hypothetical protein PV797_10000 [Clostridiaceae bacterium M8S5]